MRTPVVKTLSVLFAVLAVAALFATDAAAQVNAMSGKSKMTYTKKEIVPVGDVEGHVFMLGYASGVNANTGKWAFMDGAKARSVGFQELTKGNGPQTGYFILSKDGSETVAKITGAIKTVLSSEGKPLTTMSGEWKYVKGTGVYEGCTGQGTYQGNFTAENEYVVEFKGVLVQ
jgi:hypothetical protein